MCCSLAADGIPAVRNHNRRTERNNRRLKLLAVGHAVFKHYGIHFAAFNCRRNIKFQGRRHVDAYAVRISPNPSGFFRYRLFVYNRSKENPGIFSAGLKERPLNAHALTAEQNTALAIVKSVCNGIDLSPPVRKPYAINLNLSNFIQNFL